MAFSTDYFDPIKHDDTSEWFHCQFCPMNFDKYDEYKSHTFGHFYMKSCSECHVRLIKICDEWFEIHTPSNCEKNHHINASNRPNTGNIGGSDVVIKQEPVAEMESEQIDELLNIKTDIDADSFGDIFANTLDNIEINEGNTFDSIYDPSSNNSTDDEDLNPQFKYEIVSITEKNSANKANVKNRSKGFKCRSCEKTFKSRFMLECHNQTYHDENKEQKCNYCHQSFGSFISLGKHLKQCPLNDKKRIYAKTLSSHPTENGPIASNEARSNKFSFKCRLCGRRYPSRYYLAKHMIRHKQTLGNKLSNAPMTHDLDEDLMERRKYVRVHPHRPRSNFICDLCGKCVSRFELMEEHMSKHHSAGDRFRCQICGRVYPSRYYLSKHLLRHKSASTNRNKKETDDLDKGLMERNKYTMRLDPSQRAKNLTCDQCGKKFKYQYLLLEHKSSQHSGDNKFQCKKCDRFYPNRYYLTKHLKRHEDAEKNGIPFDQLGPDLDDGLMERNKYVRLAPNEQKSSYDCEDCGRTFSKFFLLTEHRRSKHEDGFSCRKCGRTYPNRYYLAKHMKRHEKANTTDVLDDEVEFSDEDQDFLENKVEIQMNEQQLKMDFYCDHCGLVYKSNELLMEHMASNHTEIQNFKCNICNSEFSNHFYLEKHMSQHQALGEDDNLDEGLIERKKYYKVHPHRPLNNFICDICQKVFTTYYSIRDHMKIVHSTKNYQQHPCKICGRVFKLKKRLDRHKILKHPNDRKQSVAETKHICSICGRLFPEKSKMIAHEKTHLGIMSSCEICGKKFLHKRYVRKHILSVHSNVRPFTCDVDGCEWTFAYQQCLKRHKARKHGMITNRNACPICSKEFPDSTYHLKRHLKAHANNTAKEYTPQQKENPDHTS